MLLLLRALLPSSNPAMPYPTVPYRTIAVGAVYTSTRCVSFSNLPDALAVEFVGVWSS